MVSATTTHPVSSQSNSEVTGGNQQGLSKEADIGLGLGLGVALPLAGIVVIMAILLYRLRKKKHMAALSQDEGRQMDRGIHELSGIVPVTELDVR
jgi:hypothetical protein